MATFNFDPVVNKLILLYVFDKMEIPLTEASVIDICTQKNDWINYMDCKDILWQLVEHKFIYRNGPDTKESRYVLSYDGRSCLSHYFQRIPSSLRENITKFAKEERMKIKRNQEYVADFFRHDDGSYTAVLQIKESAVNENILDITIKTRDRAEATAACIKWKEVAPKAYEFIVENLLTDNN